MAIPNTVLVGRQPVVLTENGRLLEWVLDRGADNDAKSLASEPSWVRYSVRPKSPAIRRQGELGLLMTGRTSHGYPHFLVDFLPRVRYAEMAEETVGRLDFVVVEPLRPWQEQLLSLVDLHEHGRIPLTGDSATQLRGLVVPPHWHLNGRGASAPKRDDLGWLVDRVLRATERRPPYRMLWVSRSDAGRRRVRNEDAVFAQLEGLGYEYYVPGDHPPLEQARAFSEAKVIVGLHGAGLVNLLFASQDSQVIELLPAGYQASHYRSLANVMGVRYQSVVEVGEKGLSGDVVVDEVRLQCLAAACSESSR